MASIVIQLFDVTAAAITKPSLSVTVDDDEGVRSAPFTSSPLDEYRGTALKYRTKVRDASKKNAKAESF
jgi:hypothetical protein